MGVPFRDLSPYLNLLTGPNGKPTLLYGVGGFATRRYLLRSAYPHTLSGLQQQQQHIEVVLGMIVIASKIFVPRLAKLASS